MKSPVFYSTAQGFRNYMSSKEGFANSLKANPRNGFNQGFANPPSRMVRNPMRMKNQMGMGMKNRSRMNTSMGMKNQSDGFQNYGPNAGGARSTYEPMGPFDAIQLDTGNSVSKWRYTSPNESLNGPEVEMGPDSLFMFKNNQCKPECCGSSFSCNGGCVCTTPSQRDFINQRGGNRTSPESGV